MNRMILICITFLSIILLLLVIIGIGELWLSDIYEFEIDRYLFFPVLLLAGDFYVLARLIREDREDQEDLKK